MTRTLRVPRNRLHMTKSAYDEKRAMLHMGASKRRERDDMPEPQTVAGWLFCVLLVVQIVRMIREMK